MLCNAVVVWLLRVALWTVEVDVVVMMVVDDDDAMATSLDIFVVEDMPNDAEEEDEEPRTFPHNTLNICMRVGGSNKVMKSMSFGGSRGIDRQIDM